MCCVRVCHGGPVGLEDDSMESLTSESLDMSIAEAWEAESAASISQPIA